LKLGLLAVCMLGLFGVASACSPFSSKTASAARTASPAKSPAKADPAITPPAGFPADVPVYPGARLTAAAPFTSPGQVAWGMVWQTSDPVDKVQAFYKTRFSQGDWQITFNGNANQAFSANFSRKSNPKAAGMVSAEGSSGITTITLYLSMPT
jgi:hypothetical protein